MNRHIIAVMAIGVFALGTMTADADQVSGLTTFIPDNTVSSSEMNANFEEVRLSVNDNDGRITNNSNSIATKQDQLSGTCSAGEVVSNIAAGGAISCTTDRDSAGVDYDQPSTNQQITTTASVMSSFTLIAPSSGYVILQASGNYAIQHTAGVTDALATVININDCAIPAIVGNRSYARIKILSNLPSGEYYGPISTHWVVPVTSGSHTLCWIGESTNNTNINIIWPQLIGIFVRNRY